MAGVPAFTPYYNVLPVLSCEPWLDDCRSLAVHGIRAAESPHQLVKLIDWRSHRIWETGINQSTRSIGISPSQLIRRIKELIYWTGNRRADGIIHH